MYPENLTPEGFPRPGVLEHSTTVLTAYGGTELMQHGKCQIDCDCKGRKSVTTFFVTQAEGPAITGVATSLELNRVALNCSVQQSSPLNVNRTCEHVTPIKDKDDLVIRYPDCFDGVGKGQCGVTIEYRPGKHALEADALSRFSSEGETTIPDLNMQIHDVCSQFSSECFQKIRAETA